MIEFFYNNSIHVATLITSFFVVIEKHLKMKFNIKNYLKKSESIINYTMKMKKLHKNLCYRFAKTNVNYMIQHDKRHFFKIYLVN